MKCVPIKERLAEEKTIDRNAEIIALACTPFHMWYLEAGVTTN
jgi:hypothetical protein